MPGVGLLLGLLISFSAVVLPVMTTSNNISSPKGSTSDNYPFVSQKLTSSNLKELQLQDVNESSNFNKIVVSASTKPTNDNQFANVVSNIAKSLPTDTNLDPSTKDNIILISVNNDRFADVLLNIRLDRYKRTVGLKNIGLTCYMNACLQALTNLPNFASDFLKSVSEKYDRLIELKNLGNSEASLTVEFIKVVQSLWSNNSAYVPTDFKKVLGSVDSSFEGVQSNDPAELLVCLLDILQSSLNSTEAKSLPSVSSNNTLGKETLANDLVFNNSIIKNYFYFIRKDEFLCENGSNSKKQSCFVKCSEESSLHLPLEHCRSVKHKISFGDNSIPYDKTPISIRECFSICSNSASLYEYTCDTCNKSNQRCVQSTSYECLPRVLPVVLDRGENKKFPVRVQIDKELDLANFTQFAKNLSENKGEYWLSSVICHKGESDNTGHFVTFNRHTTTDPWYIYNDDKVTVTSEDHVNTILNGTANWVPYMLFYVKK